jgi:hypothetical protein
VPKVWLRLWDSGTFKLRKFCYAFKDESHPTLQKGWLSVGCSAL